MRGIHKDPDKHRADVLAYYYAHKHEPAFIAQRRATRRRYSLRWYKSVRPQAQGALGGHGGQGRDREAA